MGYGMSSECHVAERYVKSNTGSCHASPYRDHLVTGTNGRVEAVGVKRMSDVHELLI